MTKYVYSFDEGKKELKELLGGKGANVSEMTRIGVPVPPGFTITTEVCDLYYKNDRTYPSEVLDEIAQHLQKLEENMGKKLGAEDDPLLVSVRSGAAVSMPGMMDTVLNLGLNDKSIHGLIAKTGNERFAWDAYRRFLQMFGDVVLSVKRDYFEHGIQAAKDKKGVKLDTELDVEDLKALVEEYKAIIKRETGSDFPQDPKEQLQHAIDAVFGSWNNERAIAYRNINDIRGLLGTAVNVQSMVFGNMGETSGTGVAFTRDPSTGERRFFGEFLMNAQGEDVVAGIRTPQPISELENTMPDVYNQLVEIYQKLETHYKDMQDLEFTIQEGKLFLLQTRTGKRTAQAAVRIAVEMVDEGLIDQKTAVLRLDPNQIDQLLHKRLDPKAKEGGELLTKGLPASPGAAVGKAVFHAKDAQAMKEKGENVILVRTETSPEDIEGMHAAQGILTSRGGMTSHAAVVARGMGTACVAGCEEINVSEDAGEFSVGNTIIKEGDFITLDGSTGEVFKGELSVIDPELSGNFEKLMSWADEYRTLKVRTNADNPHDSQVARSFGAEGIGLCRTEHMFFEPERIMAVREMILSETEEEREKALTKILPYQQSDFLGIFQAMQDLPVTIRLLDPPLHEFLPKEEKEIGELAQTMGITVPQVKKKIDSLHEFNPMLGHRGVRLAVTYPEIARMQVKAIIGAALEIRKSGKDIVPEIMVPLVGHSDEIRILKKIIDDTAIPMIKESGVELHYKLGTMIEVPRGAIVADKVAKWAQFFSFGTNDLTQLCLGYSRDDAGKFIPDYLRQGVLEYDPFQSVDESGVGELMKIAIEKGRGARPDLKLGICGEHGGDPRSVEFCHTLGLEYVSCSPFRVPIARLAAAHAAIKSE